MGVFWTTSMKLSCKCGHWIWCNRWVCPHIVVFMCRAVGAKPPRWGWGLLSLLSPIHSYNSSGGAAPLHLLPAWTPPSQHCGPQEPHRGRWDQHPHAEQDSQPSFKISNPPSLPTSHPASTLVHVLCLFELWPWAPPGTPALWCQQGVRRRASRG